MPADHQVDDDLKSIYRALAEGRITDDEAQAAETAVHARRAAQARVMALPASRPALSRGHDKIGATAYANLDKTGT